MRIDFYTNTFGQLVGHVPTPGDSSVWPNGLIVEIGNDPYRSLDENQIKIGDSVLDYCTRDDDPNDMQLTPIAKGEGFTIEHWIGLGVLIGRELS